MDAMFAHELGKMCQQTKGGLLVAFQSMATIT
jgi:hypothetical protein